MFPDGDAVGRMPPYDLDATIQETMREMGEYGKDFKGFQFDDFERLREHNQLEFKRAKGGLPKSFWETYSAFANTDGGVIVLGADEGEDGFPRPTGITNVDAMLKDLWNGLNNPERASANLLVDSDVVVEDLEGHPLVFVSVPRADRRVRPVYVGNNPKTGTYRRNGEGDYHVTEDAYLSLVRDSLRDPVDGVVLGDLTLSDLCEETVDAYRNLFRATRPKSPWLGLDDERFLMRIGAAGRATGDPMVHPTRAGLLMFGRSEDIVLEFPHYFLDCRQVTGANRWNNRITSSTAGEWSGNVYDFWHRANLMLTDGLPVPFRLRPDMIRDDDTPQHRAVREALTNALVHADYFGRAGVVCIRNRDSVEISNPGLLRIPLELIEAGGISEARNETMLHIFSLVNIGERAGSGYDVLVQGTESAGKPAPVLNEIYEPERVRLFMELETSGLAEFRLPGMGGEGSPLVTRLGSPDDRDGGTGRTVASDIPRADLSEDELALVEAVRSHPGARRAELARAAGLSERTFDRTVSRLVERGILARVGSRKSGNWIVVG